jgi:hypothetical protein
VSKQKVAELRRPGEHPGVRTIDRQVTHGSQDLTYVEVLMLRDHRLRVEIRSDAYEDQSYARIKRWDGNQWQFLHDLGRGVRKTPAKMHYKDPAIHGSQEAVFLKDRDTLVKLAGEILP